MWLLENKSMTYAWGSPTLIPDFIGEEPCGDHFAELWMGAHPLAPSIVVTKNGKLLLPDLIDSDPEAMLGSRVLTWTNELPFLVKFLAASSPLSIQVHPGKAQAAKGFHHEVDAGIALTDPTRLYKDPNAKPEIMIALEPTQTLVGFRSAPEVCQSLELLNHPWGDALAALVQGSPDDLHSALEYLIDRDIWAPVRASVLEKCRTIDDPVFELVQTLTESFPTDPGVMAPILMNCAHYDIGEVLYTAPETLHAHVTGFGVEVMATSDNVLRAALTPKHVDTEALLANLNGIPAPPCYLESTTENHTTYCPPIDDFAVTIIPAGADGPTGPRIALILDGEVTLTTSRETMTLHKGQSAFLADADGPVATSGEGQILFAYVP